MIVVDSTIFSVKCGFHCVKWGISSEKHGIKEMQLQTIIEESDVYLLLTIF